MAIHFTRCPQCRTTFRITPQQLALREGQVRCGHCRTVFNAYAALVNFKGERLPGPGMESYQPETMTLRDSVSAPEGAFTVMPRPLAPAAVTSAAAQVLAAEEANKLSSPPPRAPAPGKSVLPPLGENHRPLRPAEKASEEKPHGKKHFRKHKPSPLALVLDPAKEPTVWQRLRLPSWSRPFFYFVSLSGLALLLAAQTTVFLHDELASAQPKLTPALSLGCRWLDCKIRPLQNLDALAIEASDLQSGPVDSQQLLLTVTLRNRGDKPAAYPSLFLELTDAEGSLLSRRAFTPEMYLLRATDADAGIPAARDHVLRLSLHSNFVAASGYRLSLAYS